MVSVPAHAFNVVGTRLLVVARKQRYMLGIAVATAILNALLDTVLYLWIGPIGIVVATVVRALGHGGGVRRSCCAASFPQTIGQELAPRPDGDGAPGPDPVDPRSVGRGPGGRSPRIRVIFRGPTRSCWTWTGVGPKNATAMQFGNARRTSGSSLLCATCQSGPSRS